MKSVTAQPDTKSRFVKMKLHRVVKCNFFGLVSESERACCQFPFMLN